MNRSRVLILLAFAAVYLIWGSTYLAIRYAIETLPPFLKAGTREKLSQSCKFLLILSEEPAFVIY